MNFFLGIDPGKTGGYALLNGSGQIHVMKCFDGLTNEAIVHEIRILASKFRFIAVKEEFASYGVDGRISFVVGEQHGWLDSTLSYMGIRVFPVRPADWHKFLHAKEPNMKPKALSVRAAGVIFPGEKFLRSGQCKKPHMGILEAALIAEYGRRLAENPKSCSNNQESA